LESANVLLVEVIIPFIYILSAFFGQKNSIFHFMEEKKFLCWRLKRDKRPRAM